MATCVLCSSLAQVFCSADSAFLCLACDKSIHEANVISRSHKRLPVCALCKRSAACVYCKEDEAALCQGCEREVHSANPLPHTCLPIEQAMATGLLAAASAAPAAPCAKPHEAPQDDDTSSAVGDNLSSGLNSLAVVPDAGAFPAEPAAPAGKDLKGLWGKDFDNLDLEAAWLGNFDMGLDLADFLADESDAPGLVPSVVPQPAAPAPAQAPAQASMAPADFLSFADEFPLVPSFLPDLDDQTPASGSKRSADSSFDSMSAAQRVKTEPGFVLAPPPPPYSAAMPEPVARKPVAEYKPVSTMAAAGNGANLTREQRVARWLEKRKNRKFTKIVRYASRKAYAEVRPRIKGRFATKQEVEEYNARKAAGIVGPEDHLMVFS